MGKSLADAFPIARRVFEEADDALGFSLSKLCFEGPEEEINLTENTQVILLLVSTLCYDILHQNTGVEITARLGKVRVRHERLLGGVATLAYAPRSSDSPSLWANDASSPCGILFREAC